MTSEDKKIDWEKIRDTAQTWQDWVDKQTGIKHQVRLVRLRK